MSTITKTATASTDAWSRVDAGYAAISMRRRLAFPVFCFIGAGAPSSDDAEGVQEWNTGAITVRDLGGSQVWVKAANDPNEIDLVLSDSAALLASASAGFAELALSLDTSAYADGDVLAATQELASAVGSNGGVTAIHSVSVIDTSDQGAPFDILFFDASVSVGAENDPVSVSDVDAVHFLGMVSVLAADYVDLGGCSVASLRNLGLVLKAAPASRSLFVAVVSRGAGTYGASGLVLRFGFI